MKVSAFVRESTDLGEFRMSHLLQPMQITNNEFRYDDKQAPWKPSTGRCENCTKQIHETAPHKWVHDETNEAECRATMTASPSEPCYECHRGFYEDDDND